MRQTPERLRELYKLLQSKVHLKSIVMTLAVLVVFVTTYVLILPAFTLDKEEAAQQGGIDIVAEETAAMEAAEETAQPEEVEVKEEAAETTSEKANASEEKAEAKTEAKEEKAESKDAAKEEKAEAKDTAKEEKAGVKLLTKPKTLTAVTGKSANVTVSAEVDKAAEVPADVSLQAKELTKDTAGFDYDKHYEEVLKALGTGADGISMIKFYDISLESDMQDDSVEPSDKVNVKIAYDRGIKVSDADNIHIVHFGEEKTEVLDTNATVNSKSQLTEASFETDGFSVFAIAETGTIVIEHLAQDGETYQISIDIPAEANIPAGSDLVVEELTEESVKYAEYLNKAAKTLKLNNNEISYIKLLDISIVKDGKEIQPAVPVSVSIELKDKDDASNTQVIHFEDKPVLMDADTNGNTVSFETPGFSVYAVIGGVEPTSRMTVNFYGKDTNTPLATVYVKNEDDLEMVEKIVYDPGAGTLDEGEIFRGWVIGDVAPKGTTATIPEYTVEMASTEGALKTIEDIRTWAAAFDAESDNHITEGDVVNIRAAIYKAYVITYLDDKGIAQSADNVLIMPDDSSAYYEYKISQSYTPVKDTVKFNGWEPTDATKGHITSDTQQEDNLYQKDDVIRITGNVDFKVSQSEGHWIVFHENGKGGTYNAPQFVERGNNTEDPGTMTRKGYTFGGWYTEVTGEADEHGYKQVVESSRFTFGDDLDDFGEGKLNLYAKWTPVTTAPYTIIFWGEKIGPDGKVAKGQYEVLESFVNNNGTVGENIPYISRDNGVEDYAYQTGQGAFGRQLDVLPNGQNDDEKGIMGHYRGFNLTEASKNQQVEITPEGDAVLNLYYDRAEYNFKFYLYRESGNGNNRYTYANNSGNGSSLNDLVTWHNASSNHPSAPSYTDQTETHRFNNTNYTYHYFTISAHYGEDISTIWPTYDKIQGADNRVPVSYVMMVGTHLKPRATSSGTGTVKGVISVMDWNILGATNNADGNYVIVRFPGSNYNWRYHIWFEAIDADHIPAGKRTYTYEGKLYYEETVMAVRSSNTDVTAQNEPKYEGFEYQLRVGQNNQGVWPASSTINTTDANGHKCGTYWTTTESGTTLYHLNYIYNRQQFKITYFDGNYVDGNGNTNQNKSSEILHKSGLIPQGSEIPDEYKNYVPEAPEPGYVFKGWYLDAGCTVEYPWDTMPVGPINGGSAINVYAKWQQIQYRVYLKSNVPADEEFTWGSSNQGTCFRVTYGETVSLPTGRDREGWEFLGWYTSPTFEPSSRFTEDYALTESNVTTPYDQDTEYTDSYDKWGNLNDPKGNSDKENNRDWITKKLVLYAKWHQKLEGAEGINIVYDPILASEGVEPPTGHNPPTDDTYYIDTAMATAQAGSTADDPTKYQFECWVVQKWNGNEFEDTDVEVYPGDTFEVLKANAKEEDYTDPDNPNITKKYTVQLRAKYKPIEDHTPTHIDWYKNYEEDGKHEAFHQDPALKINEPVGIQPAPTREGYSFIGWARVETTRSHSYVPEEETTPVADVLPLDSNDVFIKWEDGKFKAQNDDGDWVEVTEVAADELTPYHDMYAVWEKKTYSVTVIKNVVEDTDNEIPFLFSPLFAGMSGDYTASFNLVGKEDGSTQGGTTYPHSKTFANIPYGTEFSITEAVNQYYDLESAKYTVTDADDSSKNVEDVSYNNGGSLTVDGNTTITFNNVKKIYDITIKKTDDQGNKKDGAVFKVNRMGDTTYKYYMDDITVGEETYPFETGDYQLIETNAPNGFIIAKNAVTFTVNANGSVTITSDDTIPETGEPIATANQKDGKWTVSIKNVPGKPLPHTGGIGTTIFYILGGILVIGCGVVLVARKRMGAQK